MTSQAMDLVSSSVSSSSVLSTTNVSGTLQLSADGIPLSVLGNQSTSQAIATTMTPSTLSGKKEFNRLEDFALCNYVFLFKQFFMHSSLSMKLILYILDKFYLNSYGNQ